MRTRQLRLTRPLHLQQTVAPLRVHLGDPTVRVSRDEVVRSSRTPDGPATLACRVFGDGLVDAGAWGPGAEHVLEALPALLGEHDDATAFDASLQWDIRRVQGAGLRWPQRVAMRRTGAGPAGAAGPGADRSPPRSP